MNDPAGRGLLGAHVRGCADGDSRSSEMLGLITERLRHPEVRLRGTHLGTFRGIPVTSRTVDVRLLDMIRVENGRFAEQWGGPDTLDLLQQLGATIAARYT